jgi:hypothetical protein
VLVIFVGIAGIACSGCATLTGPPSAVNADSAVVTGSFATNTGGQVEGWFEYGPTTAYGSETEHQLNTLDPGVSGGGLAGQLTGLQRNTVYHYRACASDSQQQGGPGCGEDRTFKTQPVNCGDTVTTDIKLTADLGACFGQFALKVGADGLDINLGGHTMFGSVGPHVETIPGIVNDGHDDLTVRNGTLSGFGTAFDATDASRNAIRNADVGGLDVGASFVGGADNEIHRSEMSGPASGAVRAEHSPGLVLADSQVQALFNDAGALIQSDDARIVNNRFVPVPGLDYEDLLPALKLIGNRARIAGNSVSGVWSDGFVLAGSGNVVVDNELTGKFGDGILVTPFSSGVVLRRNVVQGFGDDGIDVQAAGTKLEDNHALGNADWGIDAVPGVTDLGGNTASGNGQAAQCRNVSCG